MDEQRIVRRLNLIIVLLLGSIGYFVLVSAPPSILAIGVIGGLFLIPILFPVVIWWRGTRL